MKLTDDETARAVLSADGFKPELNDGDADGGLSEALSKALNISVGAVESEDVGGAACRGGWKWDDTLY